jgi:hypothetical protein
VVRSLRFAFKVLCISMTFRPDLRDYFILSPFSRKREDLPRLLSTLTTNIRFLWSHGLCDVWTKNINSDLYSFSSSFYERFEDIQCWTLNSDFFEFWPDLIGYIPMYNPGQGIVFGGFLAQEHHNRSCTGQGQRAQYDAKETG